ncbi:hypothetical protein AAF712_013205 [Marasmius tenuissimus]|uniref:Prolyl 4-hydroxylase alpha subunit domain-containing protein n=1 Tax=Marasmius tenuissimus TaxID=585030 RepID=A0ABR2ZEM2_9AGAR|nr:hypothetical protein PM082_016916 [Marasmius tenuissimus]
MHTKTLDFSSTSLASCYSGFYAKILDDVFTPTECAELVKLAASQIDGWKPAGLSTREEKQTVHRNFRNSERTLVIDEAVSQKIFDRLRPLVEEIAVIEPNEPWAGITGKAGRKQGPTWALDSISTRLSFLRYGPGHYFKPHCDGLNESENGSLKSFVTLHLYLTDETSISEEDEFFTCSETQTGTYNQSDTVYDGVTHSSIEPADEHDNPRQPLEGGTTRFWSPNKKEFLDVEPKIGRVLVFQQRMLIHSGEEVKSGMKYTMRGDFMFREAKK